MDDKNIHSIQLNNKNYFWFRKLQIMVTDFGVWLFFLNRVFTGGIDIIGTAFMLPIIYSTTYTRFINAVIILMCNVYNTSIILFMEYRLFNIQKDKKRPEIYE